MTKTVLIWRINGKFAKNVRITRKSGESNRATLQVGQWFDVDTRVTITCNGETAFIGDVTSCKHDDTDTFSLVVEEVSRKLWAQYIRRTHASGFITPHIIIRYKYGGTTRTISDYLDRIIGSGNYEISGTYGSSTTVPGIGVPLQDLMICHMTVGTALKRFVVDTCGLTMWFEDGSLKPIIGRSRNPGAPLHLALPEEYIQRTLVDEDSRKPVVKGVCVKNDDGTKFAVAGDVHNIGATFQLTGSFSTNELKSVASAILAQRTTPKKTWVIKLDAGVVRFKEGMEVLVGDQTIDEFNPAINLEHKSYIINQVDIDDTSTSIYVGSTRLSIFDLFKDSLKEVDGASIPREPEESESDEFIVQPGVPDKTHHYVFSIDPALCSDVKVTFNLGAFANNATDIPDPDTPNTYEEEDDDNPHDLPPSYLVPKNVRHKNYSDSQTSVTIPAGSTSEITVPVSNLPYLYNSGEIFTQYTVKSEGSFDVTWNATFTGENIPDDLVSTDDADVEWPDVAPHTSLAQRFKIDAIDVKASEAPTNTLNGTITITVKNNGSASIELGTIATKVSFLYYSDLPEDGHLASDLEPSPDPIPEPDGPVPGYEKFISADASNGTLYAFPDPVFMALLNKGYVSPLVMSGYQEPGINIRGTSIPACITASPATVKVNGKKTQVYYAKVNPANQLVNAQNDLKVGANTSMYHTNTMYYTVTSSILTKMKSPSVTVSVDKQEGGTYDITISGFVSYVGKKIGIDLSKCRSVLLMRSMGNWTGTDFTINDRKYTFKSIIHDAVELTGYTPSSASEVKMLEDIRINNAPTVVTYNNTMVLGCEHVMTPTSRVSYSMSSTPVNPPNPDDPDPDDPEPDKPNKWPTNKVMAKINDGPWMVVYDNRAWTFHDLAQDMEYDDEDGSDPYTFSIDTLHLNEVGSSNKSNYVYLYTPSTVAVEVVVDYTKYSKTVVL